MKRALQLVGKGLITTVVAITLGFGFTQSVSAATRTSGLTAVFGCVEGDCNAYCMSIGFPNGGDCPINGGHCICRS